MDGRRALTALAPTRCPRGVDAVSDQPPPIVAAPFETRGEIANRSRSHDRIFVSSSALKARTVAAAVEECERRGLTRLELTSSFPYYEGIRQDVIGARQRGIRLLIHNYFPPPQHGFVINLASGNPEIRGRSIEHCRASLALSAEIGAPLFSVHAGFSVDPRPSDLGGRLTIGGRRTRADTARVFFDTVSTLCDTAKTLGVQLLIENNVLSPRNLVEGRNELLLGVTAEDFHELFEAVNSPSLGMLLDVAHLKVSAQTLGVDRRQTLEEVRPYVRALHLSDNDGTTDNNQPFEQDAWFVQHLPMFPSAVCVIETIPLDPPALVACMRIIEDAA